VFKPDDLPKSTALTGLLDFLYPPYCLVCDGEISEPGQVICRSCWLKSSNNGAIFCVNCRKILIDTLKCPDCSNSSQFPVFCLGHYIPPLKEIIHHFKYHGFSRLGEDLLINLLSPYLEILNKLEIDYTIPIPLDSYREKGRAFNQAAILSDIISRKVNSPFLAGALTKDRRTRDQTKLDILEREKNMKGAFKADTEMLLGKRVLLVDDVITTGATLKEAASAILNANGAVVAALVVASAS